MDLVEDIMSQNIVVVEYSSIFLRCLVCNWFIMFWSFVQIRDKVINIEIIVKSIKEYIEGIMRERREL